MIDGRRETVFGALVDVWRARRQGSKDLRARQGRFELDEIRGIDLSQIVQTTPTTLGVRLRVSRGAGAESVWHEVRASVRRILDAHGLANVIVGRGDEEPEQSPGGKYRTVIPLPENHA